MTEKEIAVMDKVTLLSPDTIIDVLDMPVAEKSSILAQMEIRAAQLKIRTTFTNFVAALKREYCPDQEVVPKAKSTKIDDFVQIMRQEDYFSGLKYNEFTKSPEISDTKSGKMRAWDDFDDSAAKAYLESMYSLRGERKYFDAFNILLSERSYNPVKEAIEAVKWDGIDRIDTLLIKWLKCEDTPYTRELSRLLFAGGIHRAYEPGCKFDDVIVLVGKQGCGKSTFIQWLALSEELFGEIDSIEGKEAKENLLGKWIIELGELLAVTKARECEAVKAFLSRKADRFRASYGRRTLDYPRQCIFIGSTNKQQFLTDKTGNRRMFPCKVSCTIQWLTKHRDEIKSDIGQCWAEALAKYDTEYMACSENKDIVGEIAEQQQSYMEEDYREGMIKSYLEARSRVCVAELWELALNNDLNRMTRKDSNEIVLILQTIDGWERGRKSSKFGKYGVQVEWVRTKTITEIDEKSPF